MLYRGWLLVAFLRNKYDQIDIEIAGADDFQFTANTFTALSGSSVAIAAGGAITNAGSMAPDISSTGKTLVMGF